APVCVLARCGTESGSTAASSGSAGSGSQSPADSAAPATAARGPAGVEEEAGGSAGSTTGAPATGAAPTGGVLGESASSSSLPRPPSVVGVLRRGTLPFTGLPLPAFVLAGLVALGAGLAMRMRTAA
ncbi:MAG: hypothetical protein V7644_2227, partial [Actinomycetota bacterium]